MAIRHPARRGETADVTALADLTDVSVAAVTAGFVMLANGSQYVGRLLLEADISDLQTYLLAEVNDLTAAVTWANIPIANVPTGSTSSTVSLGDHLHDGILDTNLLDKTAFEIVTGRWDFESDGSEPQLCIVDSDSNGVATRAFIEFLGKGDVLTGRMGYLSASSGIFTIDNALPNAGVELTSAGVQKLRVDIDGTTVTGTIFIDNTSGEKVVLRDTNSTGNAVLNFIAFKDMNDLRQGVVGFGSSSNDDLFIATDAGFGDVLLNPQGVTALRASNTAVAIGVPLTATSYDGILAANLLDKTAAETLTQAWTFTKSGTNPPAIMLSSAIPTSVWNETGAPANSRRWEILAVGEQMRFRVIDDASTAAVNWLLVSRSLNVIDSIAFAGPLTATSYDGIIGANLLDKTATEVVTGGWTINSLTLGGQLNCVDNDVNRPVLEDYAIQKHSEAVSAGVLDLNMALGNSMSHLFTANVTSVTVSNPPPSGKHGEIWLRLKQHASSPKTIAWPSKFHFPAGTDHQMTGTVNAVDIVHLVTIDGGTTYDCTFVKDSK